LDIQSFSGQQKDRECGSVVACLHYTALDIMGKRKQATRVEADAGNSNNTAAAAAAANARGDLGACEIITVGVLLACILAVARIITMAMPPVSPYEPWAITLAAQTGAEPGAVAMAASLYAKPHCMPEFFPWQAEPCPIQDLKQRFALAYPRLVAITESAIKEEVAAAAASAYPHPAEVAAGYVFYMTAGKPIAELQRAIECLAQEEEEDTNTGGGDNTDDNCDVAPTIAAMIHEGLTPMIRCSLEPAECERLLAHRKDMHRMWHWCFPPGEVCDLMPRVKAIVNAVLAETEVQRRAARVRILKEKGLEILLE
jgi:hypothetical protein